MLTVKEAAQAARAFATTLYGSEELRGLRVEEVDLSEDGRVWAITLGWADRTSPEVRYGAVGGVIEAELLRAAPRVYKTFHVDGETGTVRSMKIRSVA